MADLSLLGPARVTARGQEFTSGVVCNLPGDQHGRGVHASVRAGRRWVPPIN